MSGAAVSPSPRRPWAVTLAEIRAALGFAHDAGEVGGLLLQGVSIDSRTVAPGDLFIALPGDHFDGHDYVATAVAAGAAAALVEREVRLVGLEAPVLTVPSTQQALMRLAGWWRDTVNPDVIAITGSNGKTTVKEMVACILAADARARGVDPDDELLATRGNFNNHIGLPLTLLRLRRSHRRAVVELGMNHAGELARLSTIARPRVALVNNVQRAHVGLLGSLEQVARAKAEIFGGLVPGGVAVINADDPHAGLLAELAGSSLQRRFSCVQSVEVGPLLSQRSDPRGQTLAFRVDGQQLSCHLPLPGHHNAANALAAVAAVGPLGVSSALACAALEHCAGAPGRLQTRTLADGTRVIDDSYNANPDSVLAAIAVLAECPGRRILVLGDLGELGLDAPALHAELGRACRAAGIDALFGLGTLVAASVASFGAGARLSIEPDELCERVRPLLGPEVTVLVKGSRFMRMERVVEGLASFAAAPAGAASTRATGQEP